MAIKRITPMSQIMGYMEDQLAIQEERLIRKLAYLGEQCVIKARSLPSPPIDQRGRKHTPNYIDDTQNLRNSIGYAIIKNGQIVIGGEFKNDTGGRTGNDFVRELVAKFPRGIVLIVVAGMNYAGYVEARGYDVLTSSEIFAEREMPKILKQLGYKL